MGNVYGAQHIASYLVYEINEIQGFINNLSLQNLLTTVENKWQQIFGHSAFEEMVHGLEKGFSVKEVYQAYKENGDSHIELPAKEYYLKYGSFQLVERTYAVPNFTIEEEELVQSIIERSRLLLRIKAS